MADDPREESIPASTDPAAPMGMVARGEACAFFGVDPCAWKRWERIGWVRSIRVGRRCWFVAAVLNRLAAEAGRVADRLIPIRIGQNAIACR